MFTQAKIIVRMKLAILLFAATMLVAFGQISPAYATTILVTSGADNITMNDGVCTLREAIMVANADHQAVWGDYGCADGNGHDTISLSVNATLSSALPTLDTEITVDGNGYTINGNGVARVLNIGVNGDVTVQNVILTGGSATTGQAGGILNAGLLVVTNSTLSGNSAAGGGGGIWNSGILVVENTTISENSAGNTGGALYNKGTVTINHSTLSNNLATNYGGGIYNTGNGSVMFTNSTLSGNQTSANSGGGIWNCRALTISNSTLTGNYSANKGGGLFSTNSGSCTANAMVNLNNSLVSGNSASNSSGVEIYNNSGTISANTYNVFGQSGLTNAQALFNFTAGANDRTATSNGTHATALNNILNATLAFNGGVTRTHALVAGSPAIDIAPSGESVDQCGVSRPSDGNGTPTSNEYDAGAFEYQSP